MYKDVKSYGSCYVTVCRDRLLNVNNGDGACFVFLS